MLEFFSGVVIGAGLFYVFAVWTVRRVIARAMAEDAVTAAQEKDLVIRAHVEEHNGVFYFYNEKNNEFLIQGGDITELIEHLESRRPGTTVHVVRGDEAAIAQLKAQLK
jgi:hypothetical protein